MEKNGKTNLNKTYPIRKKDCNELQASKKIKLSLISLILLGNVAWGTPSYAGNELEEDMQRHIVQLKKDLDNFYSTIRHPHGERATLGRGWANYKHTLTDTINSFIKKTLNLSRSHNQCLQVRDQCFNDLNTERNSKLTCNQENRGFIEAIKNYVLVISDLQKELRDGQDAESFCNNQSLELSTDNTLCNKKNQEFIEVIKNHVQVISDLQKELKRGQDAESICNNNLSELSANHTRLTDKFNAEVNGHKECEDANKVLFTRGQEQGIKLEKCEDTNKGHSAQSQKQQAELEKYENQLTRLKDRAVTGLMCCGTGFFSSILTEFIRDGVKYSAKYAGWTDKDANRYANYTAMGITLFKTGMVAYYAPFYALPGITNLLVSGSLDYYYEGGSSGSVTAGSTAAFFTSFVQDYLTGQNTLLDHSIAVGKSLLDSNTFVDQGIAIGGYWIGSTIGTQLYVGIKDLLSIRGPAAPGGGAGGNGGPGPDDDSDDNDSDDGSSSKKNSQIFAERLTSLQPLIAQLGTIDLNANSSVLQEDMQLFIKDSVLLRKTVEREPVSQDMETVQLSNFKEALNNLKTLIKVAPALEEPNAYAFNLLGNLEHSAKNIIGIFQLTK